MGEGGWEEKEKEGLTLGSEDTSLDHVLKSVRQEGASEASAGRVISCWANLATSCMFLVGNMLSIHFSALPFNFSLTHSVESSINVYGAE